MNDETRRTNLMSAMAALAALRLTPRPGYENRRRVRMTNIEQKSVRQQREKQQRRARAKATRALHQKINRRR